MNNQRNVYSVKQVNSYIKHLLDEDFILKNICVRGEISNCKYHRTGHVYFSLKDESGTLSVVMFASNATKLNLKLEDGLQVIVTGSISAYERSGVYQLYARQVEDAGRGDLLKQYEELKARLEEMGMFSAEYKKKIPEYAINIGVVTADTGAVIHDIENIARRRNPYCRIVLCPAQVQGDGAAESICKGLSTLDKLGLDVIIVGRGGGSAEDLWCFNDERLARAIFACETPVISAVGHETDFTIADFVADRRAATPSEAAELAVFDYTQFENDLAAYRSALAVCMERKCSLYSEKIKKYIVQTEALSPAARLREYKLSLSSGRRILDHIALTRAREARTALQHALEALPAAAFAAAAKSRNCLDSAALEMDMAMERRTDSAKNRLALLCERLEGLSPLRRLCGGYAFVSNAGGGAVRSVSDVNSGDSVRVRLSDGGFEARVEQIFNAEE